MAPFMNLLFCGSILVVLGLVPGLFARLAAAVADFAQQVSWRFFSLPSVPFRPDTISHRPVGLAFAGLALIAFAAAQCPLV
jgi:hypothetical protein